ncbi:helix-turn-helix domain-containing protein [Spongiimicrobium salis]|uniref:helix-turn-helix domain-containing protein n=1 Tax=Spongiimicrobium salis TaxID=1667022 RepID=UPI00374D2CA2
MEEHRIQYILSGELQIAASCETVSDQVMEVYLPSTMLLFVEKGVFHIHTSTHRYEIPRGTFGIVKKYTEATIFKTWTEEEGEAKIYMFGLTNTFIRKVIHQIKFPKNKMGLFGQFFAVPPTPKLIELMKSLIVHIEEGGNMDAGVVSLKTLEALRALAEADTNILNMFREFSNGERADLDKLMHHNFLYPAKLEWLAKQSGRSLSTFRRDFKAIFNDTPHRWIMKKRLYHARQLMEKNKLRPSQVYLESGFEDLAHFSRAFKKKFAITPSQFYKNL